MTFLIYQLPSSYVTLPSPSCVFKVKLSLLVSTISSKWCIFNIQIIQDIFMILKILQPIFNLMTALVMLIHQSVHCLDCGYCKRLTLILIKLTYLFTMNFQNKITSKQI